MALPEFRLTATANTINIFAMWDDDGDLDMDPPYQRGHVWGEDRQRNLIKSVLLGIPIPSIVINSRHLGRFHQDGWDDARNAAYAVVDGKQRITAFLRFMRGGLMVPADWFDAKDVTDTVGSDRGPMVTWRELAKPKQFDFKMTPIALVEGRLPTLADERAVFDLINFGGVPQGASDLDTTTEAER